jgi:hypothetical protein
MRIRVWRGGDARLLVRATAAERGDAIVLSDCLVEYSG